MKTFSWLVIIYIFGLCIWEITMGHWMWAVTDFILDCINLLFIIKPYEN